MADFSPCRHEVDETRHIPTKKPKINPFVIKSVLESNCKRFRKKAIRENFNLKPETDHFDGSEDFFSELFFWITVWRASKEQSNFFGTKSNLKGSPLTSKATSGYFGQSVWNWIKMKRPRFEKNSPGHEQ